MNTVLRVRPHLEIYQVITNSLISTGYSNKVKYLALKQQMSIFSILSNNTKINNLKFRLSRFDLKKKNSNGNLVGVYYAMW
jgi:hypothetical protein